jgi:hypothetical protein
MSQWIAERTFTELLCSVACVAACLAMVIGAIRGKS